MHCVDNIVFYVRPSTVQVCGRLNILEKDYFGLKYSGKHGEQLWVNLRNPIHEQVDDRTELELCVKFFVKPRKLLQSVTRCIVFPMYR